MALSPSSSRGGQGTVTGVTAADTSIVVGGTAAAPTIATGTLDVIAAQHPPVAAVAMNAQKVSGVADPGAAQDAATKNYVDSVALGLTYKSPADLGTIAALPTNVYVNGASGVGATLTATAFGALAVDGTTVTVGQRILVKNEAAPSHNGIYAVTVVGGVATLYVLTRAADYNQSSEIQAGDAVFVTSGGTLGDTLWVQTTTGTVTVGTTAIAFSQLGGSSSGPTFSLSALGLVAASSALTVPLTGFVPGGGEDLRLVLMEQIPAGTITGAAICLEALGVSPSGTAQLGLYTFVASDTLTPVAVTADISASLTSGGLGIRRFAFGSPYTADGVTPLWVALAFSSGWGTNVQVSGLTPATGPSLANPGFARPVYTSLAAGSGFIIVGTPRGTWATSSSATIWAGLY